MLRTINHVSPAHRVAIAALRANVPTVSRGIIYDHQQGRAQTDSLRAHTQVRTLDSEWRRALSDCRHGM